MRVSYERAGESSGCVLRAKIITEAPTGVSGLVLGSSCGAVFAGCNGRRSGGRRASQRPPKGPFVPEPLLDLRAKIVRLQAGVRRAGSSGLALHLLYAEQRGVDPLDTEAAGLHLPVRAPRPLCDHVGKP
jgi:hypothetical protein